MKFRDVLYRLTPYVTLRISTYPNWFGLVLQFQTSSDIAVFEMEPTKQDAQNVNIIHCMNICKIQICITLPNTMLHPHNITSVYISKLVLAPIPNHFRYEKYLQFIILLSNYLQFTCNIKISPYPVTIKFPCCSTNLRNLCMSTFWLMHTRLKQ